MRSFLTMLGIIIGVASVIILVGLMEGQMRYMRESFSNLGSNQISAYLTNTPSRTVTPDQMYGFYDNNRKLFQGVSPELPVKMVIKHKTDKLKATNITGVSEQYLEINFKHMEAGRFLQYSDIAARQPVCVLGSYTASRLFGSPDKAVGETVKMDGNILKVVGVLQRQNKEEQVPGGDDDLAYLPYTTAMFLTKTTDISRYVLTTVNLQQTAQAKGALGDFLMSTYKSSDLFYVEARSDLIKSVRGTLAMMSGTLGGIGGISLLVAGVGVMNIMLVSVTERTKEIGILKSLGARKGTIMQQFVIEAAITSTMGGIMGIIVGCAVVPAIGTLIKTKSTASFSAILISFGVSVGIGLIFGYMPAKKAANLNPIDALRSD